jgi:hypothetical protein
MSKRNGLEETVRLECLARSSGGEKVVDMRYTEVCVEGIRAV